MAFKPVSTLMRDQSVDREGRAVTLEGKGVMTLRGARRRAVVGGHDLPGARRPPAPPTQCPPMTKTRQRLPLHIRILIALVLGGWAPFQHRWDGAASPWIGPRPFGDIFINLLI